MISRLRGILEGVEDGRATVRTGPLAIEVLVPAADVMRLSRESGSDIEFHCFAYLEGQAQGSSFVPRLIGFRSADDRAFFELFTTVKGIGNRKALRALARPPAEVAAAIADRDAKSLTGLPEIGKRTAETIVAELAGKVDRFVDPMAGRAAGGSAAARANPESEDADRDPAADDAVAILIHLGEAAVNARRLVDRVIEVDPTRATDPAAIVDAAYRLKEPARTS